VAPGNRILVIEDDADVREALAEAMRAAGFAVDVAVDGADGLVRLRGGPPPSLILLDLRMPRLCGAEFLRAMRDDEAHARVPVITMTAGGDRRQDGVLAHLHKPFDLDDLLEIVRSVVGAPAA
jgi:DNA-binding response OmpR family regulator